MEDTADGDNIKVFEEINKNTSLYRRFDFRNSTFVRHTVLITYEKVQTLLNKCV